MRGQLRLLGVDKHLALYGAGNVTAGATLLFNQLDADKSGSLDVGELRKALDLLGVHVDLAGARDVMAKYEGGARQQARGGRRGEAAVAGGGKLQRPGGG